MRRLLLIAAREYVAYTRTVGFWLSMLALPLILGVSVTVPLMLAKHSVVQRIAILDMSRPLAAGDTTLGQALARQLGADYDAKVVRALHKTVSPPAEADRAEALYRDKGLDALVRDLKAHGHPDFDPPRRTLELAPEPPPALARARSVTEAETQARALLDHDTPPGPDRLDAVVVLASGDPDPEAHVWTRTVGAQTLSESVRDAMDIAVEDQRLAALGAKPEDLRRAREAEPKVSVFSPRAASGGAVGLKDQLPTFVGLGAGFILWSLVMTAAGILMNSVMEEKSNRVLEILLSSASPGEILGGKVLGVAGIALTVLGVWGALGGTLLALKAPGIGLEVLGVLGAHGLWLSLLVYFVGGYLMYGLLFASVGAFCETPRDAQALMGPIMVVLMIPLLVMQVAVKSPDMPILKILSWIPFFTPFLMSARAAAHPPLIEVIATIIGMVLMAGLMVWVGGKAFRAGALSAGKVDIKGFIAAIRGKA